jgi:F0F1-type ATP synthase epsilon subunit
MRICTVSGGFAIVQPNSELSINAVEGYPLEDFSIEAVRSQISEAQKIAAGSGSEQDIAEAKIELEVSWKKWLTAMSCANEMPGFGELAGCSQVKRQLWF